MPKSIAELRADTPRRVERIKNICLAPHLVAEAQRLQAEKAEAFARAREEGGAPRRIGEPPTSSAADVIDLELAALHDKMREASGDVLLRAITGGEWRRWVTDHPAREGSKIDERFGYSIVNADDLANDLGRWVVSYNEEPVDAEGLAFILETAAAADVNDMVSIVVQMHELGVSVPKSRSVSSASQTSAPDSTSPAPSESRPDGSTAGSPPSDTSTSMPTAS